MLIAFYLDLLICLTIQCCMLGLSRLGGDETQKWVNQSRLAFDKTFSFLNKSFFKCWIFLDCGSSVRVKSWSSQFIPNLNLSIPIDWDQNRRKPTQTGLYLTVFGYRFLDFLPKPKQCLRFNNFRSLLNTKKYSPLCHEKYQQFLPTFWTYQLFLN